MVVDVLLEPWQAYASSHVEDTILVPLHMSL